MIKEIKAITSSSVEFSLNLPRNSFKSKEVKHGRSDSSITICKRLQILSTCFLRAMKPFRSSILKYKNIEDSVPPINSIYSLIKFKMGIEGKTNNGYGVTRVSLKGADSKFIFPGENASINP
jgi:hypothetical protein